MTPGRKEEILEKLTPERWRVRGELNGDGDGCQTKGDGERPGKGLFLQAVVQ